MRDNDARIVVMSLTDEELHRLLRVYLQELNNRLGDLRHAQS